MSYRVVRWWCPQGGEGPTLEDKINGERGKLISHAPQEASVDGEFGVLHWLVFKEDPMPRPGGAMRLPTRAINALREHKITQPEKHSLYELTRIPGIGPKAIVVLATRTYGHDLLRNPPSWPELEEDE